LRLALALTVLALPRASAAVSETEPNDSFEQANSVTCGELVTASMGFPGDTDFYRLSNVPPNTVLQAGVSSSGTCVAGSNAGGICDSLQQCPGGVCIKDVDLLLIAYTSDRVLRLIVDNTENDTDPTAVHPWGNTSPTEVFVEVSAFGTATGSYTIALLCDQPTDLTCPKLGSGAASTLAIDFEGDLDVFRLTPAEAVNLILDIDAEGKLFGDLKASSFDSLIRLYDSSWKAVTESDDVIGPLEPEPIDGFDSYISTHVFEAGSYYVAVTCAEDLDFFGCWVGPSDPGVNDLEYSLRRHCRSVASLSTIDCTESGTLVSDELGSLPVRAGVEVDFYQFEAALGDLIEVDIDVTDPNSKLDSAAGLFRPSGPFLDGVPLILDESPTCDFETEACNDDALAPDDTGLEAPWDSYLAFCPSDAGDVVLGVSNSLDLDFNGLDDELPQDLTFIKEFIGPYGMTLRCTPAGDADSDGVADPCDKCPSLVHADQSDNDDNGIGNVCQCGDVTGDGFTNITDALMIAFGQVGYAESGYGKCDVNGDKFCNVTDALRIARGLVCSSPECQLCPTYRGWCPPICGDRCAVCGDGICEGDEGNCNCRGDCPPLVACLTVVPTCGDGVCEYGASPGESHESCPEDCPCGGPPGCFDNAECEAAEFCAYPFGSCGLGPLGTCTDVPQNCPTVSSPVCGCDGETYSSACVAAQGGVSIQALGPCPS
jgi:hypothetical protein